MSYKLGYASQFGGFKQSFSENGVGVGLAFFPFKKENLGFHFEWNTGQWQLKDRLSGSPWEKKQNHDFRWGLSYKFGK
jgi:hypothetical protein